MSASQLAKAEGLKSLQEVSELTGQSTQTLNNWANDKPELFKVVLKGCRSIRPISSITYEVLNEKLKKLGAAYDLSSRSRSEIDKEVSDTKYALYLCLTNSSLIKLVIENKAKDEDSNLFIEDTTCAKARMNDHYGNIIEKGDGARLNILFKEMIKKIDSEIEILTGEVESFHSEFRM